MKYFVFSHQSFRGLNVCSYGHFNTLFLHFHDSLQFLLQRMFHGLHFFLVRNFPLGPYIRLGNFNWFQFFRHFIFTHRLAYFAWISLS